MTVKKLINKIQKFPGNLKVTTISDQAEKPKEITGISSLRIIQITDDYFFNGKEKKIEQEPVKEITESIRFNEYKKVKKHVKEIITLATFDEGCTIDELKKKLSKLDGKLTVAINPSGFGYYNKYFEIDNVKIIKLSRVKKPFRDIMDYTDYLSEVYTIDKNNGKDVVFLYNKNFLKKETYIYECM